MGFAPSLQGLGHLPYSRDDPYYAEACRYLGIEKGKLFTKSDVYQLFGYLPLPTLEKAHRSRATHRILGGGNRSGKTQGLTWEILPYLFWRTRGWVISANYGLAGILMDKMLIILQERCGFKRARTPENIQEFEFSYSARDHMLVMWTGAVLEVKSAENPDSMHGKGLDYAGIDEAALFPFSLYDSRVVPRLVDSGGWVMSVGTFEELQGEWFEEYFEIGQASNDLSIESWMHPTEDNYHLYTARGGETTKEVAAKYFENPQRVRKMNSKVRWPLKPGTQVYIYNVDLAWLAQEKKRINPEVYAARYEAKPRASQFLVFPTWQVTKYAGKEAEKRASFDPKLPVYLAVDPGGTYAAAAIQLKRFDDLPYTNTIARGYHGCIVDTIYMQSTVTTQEVYDIARRRPWWPNVARKNVNWDPLQGVIDVAAREQQRTWQQLGRQDRNMKRLTLRARRVLQDDGIKTLQHYLDTNTFWSSLNNQFLHVEFKRFHWRESSLVKRDTQDPRKGEGPVDEWNHLLKAIWYFLVIKFGCYGRSRASAGVTLEELRRMKHGK